MSCNNYICRIIAITIRCNNSSDLNDKNNSNLEDLKKSKMKNGSTVDTNLVALIAKIGEKITIGKSKTISNSSSNNYQLPCETSVKDTDKNEQSVNTKLLSADKDYLTDTGSDTDSDCDAKYPDNCNTKQLIHRKHKHSRPRSLMLKTQDKKKQTSEKVNFILYI